MATSGVYHPSANLRSGSDRAMLKDGVKREHHLRTEDATMSEQQCWHAVATRSRAADGAFVYAVSTTGVYCRPSCASRRPLRENVQFFPLPEAAERAGYRPCLRCRPQQQPAIDPAPEQVRRACRLIDRALDDGESGAPSLAELGAALGVSGHQLQRLFKRQLGISPRDYADAQRLGRVKARLRDGEDIAGALYDAGYGSSSRLYERSDAQLGMTRGICAVSLGGSDKALEDWLRQEYSAATIRHDEARLGAWIAAILAHLEGKAPDLGLPLDLQATGFQWRVWRELQKIPYGTTASYSAIASRIGQPAAVRAVANACAGNPAALVIPCHRVTRSDGALGGYRWGAFFFDDPAATEKKTVERRRSGN